MFRATYKGKSQFLRILSATDRTVVNADEMGLEDERDEKVEDAIITDDKKGRWS